MHLMSSASLCFGFHYEGGIAYQKYPLSFVYYFLMSIGYSRYILSIVTNQQYTSIVWLLLFQGPTSNREIKFIFTRKKFLLHWMYYSRVSHKICNLNKSKRYSAEIVIFWSRNTYISLKGIYIFIFVYKFSFILPGYHHCHL